MIPRPRNPLIVALDVSDVDAAEDLAQQLSSEVAMFKVGLELFWANGPEAVQRIAKWAPVFVDSKLHDIPTTVEHAAANIARLGVAMLNVHGLGGSEMMRAAVEGARRGAAEGGQEAPLVIAVTVLSSTSAGTSGEDLPSPSFLASDAKRSGLDGVVVSGADVRRVRDSCGEDFCLVVPGVRPSDSSQDDHVRILSPRAAIDNGCDYMVVGRPITRSDDPSAAAKGILSEIG